MKNVKVGGVDGFEMGFPDEMPDEAISSWLSENMGPDQFRKAKKDIAASELRRVQQDRREYRDGLLWANTLGNVANGFYGGLLTTGAGIARVGSVVTALPTKFYGYAMDIEDAQNPLKTLADKLDAYGHDLQNAVGNIIPESEQVDMNAVTRFMTGDVATGLGSALTFLTGGAALKGITSATAATMTLGGLQGYESGYQRSMAAGNSEVKSHFLALMNAGVGLTEAFPVGRWVDRVSKKGGFSLGNLLAEASEEAFQEAFQSTMGDVIATTWGNEDLSMATIASNAAYNALVGSVTGGIMSAGTGVASGVRSVAAGEASAMDVMRETFRQITPQFSWQGRTRDSRETTVLQAEAKRNIEQLDRGQITPEQFRKNLADLNRRGANVSRAIQDTLVEQAEQRAAHVEGKAAEINKSKERRAATEAESARKDAEAPSVVEKTEQANDIVGVNREGVSLVFNSDEKRLLDAALDRYGRNSAEYRQIYNNIVAEKKRPSQPIPGQSEAARTVRDLLGHLGFHTNSPKARRDGTWDNIRRIAEAAIVAMQPQTETDERILANYKAKLRKITNAEKGSASVTLGVTDEAPYHRTEVRLHNNYMASGALSAALDYHDSLARLGSTDGATYYKNQVAEFLGLKLNEGEGGWPSAYRSELVDKLIGPAEQAASELAKQLPIGTPVDVSVSETKSYKGVITGYSDAGTRINVATSAGNFTSVDPSIITVQSKAPSRFSPKAKPETKTRAPYEPTSDRVTGTYAVTWDQYGAEKAPVILNLDPAMPLNSQGLVEPDMTNADYDAVLSALGLAVGSSRSDMSDKLRMVRNSSVVNDNTVENVAYTYTEAEIDQWMEFWGLNAAPPLSEADIKKSIRNRISSLTDGKRGAEPQLDNLAAELGIAGWNPNQSKSKKIVALRAALNKAPIAVVSRAAAKAGVTLSKKKTKTQKVQELRSRISEALGNYKTNVALYGLRSAYVNDIIEAANNGLSIDPKVLADVQRVSPQDVGRVQEAIRQGAAIAGTYPTRASVHKKYAPVSTPGVSKRLKRGDTIPVTLVGHSEIEPGVIGANIMTIGNWQLPDGTIISTGQVLPYTQALHDQLVANGISIVAEQSDRAALEEAHYSIVKEKYPDAKDGPEFAGKTTPSPAAAKATETEAPAAQPVSAPPAVQASELPQEAYSEEEIKGETSTAADVLGVPLPERESVEEVVEEAIEPAPEPAAAVEQALEPAPEPAKPSPEAEAYRKKAEKALDELEDLRINYPDMPASRVRSFGKKLLKQGLITQSDYDNMDAQLKDRGMDKDDRILGALDELYIETTPPGETVESVEPEIVEAGAGEFDVRNDYAGETEYVYLRSRMDAGMFQIIGEDGANLIIQNIDTGVQQKVDPAMLADPVMLTQAEMRGGPEAWSKAIEMAGIPAIVRSYARALETPVDEWAVLAILNPKTPDQTIRDLAERHAFGNLDLLGARLAAGGGYAPRMKEQLQALSGTGPSAIRAVLTAADAVKTVTGGFVGNSNVRAALSLITTAADDSFKPQKSPDTLQRIDRSIARIDLSREEIPDMTRARIDSLLSLDVASTIAFADAYGSKSGASGAGDMYAAAYRIGRNLTSALPYKALAKANEDLAQPAKMSLLAKQIGTRKHEILTSTAMLNEEIARFGGEGFLSDNDIAWIRLNGLVRPALEAATGMSQDLGATSEVELMQDESYEPPIKCNSPCKKSAGSDDIGSSKERDGRLGDKQVDVQTEAAVTKATPIKSTSAKSIIDALAKNFGLKPVQGTYRPTTVEEAEAAADAIVDYYDPGHNNLANFENLIKLGNVAIRNYDPSNMFEGVSDDIKGLVIARLSVRLGEYMDQANDPNLKAVMRDAIATFIPQIGKAASLAAQTMAIQRWALKNVSNEFWVDTFVRKMYEQKGLLGKFLERRPELEAIKAKYKDAPRGIPSQMLETEIRNIIWKDIKPDTADMMWAYWYANILSGSATLFDNFTMLGNAAIEGVLQALNNPSRIGQSMSALVRGVVAGAKEWRSTGIRGRNPRIDFHSSSMKFSDDVARSTGKGLEAALADELRTDPLAYWGQQDSLIKKFFASPRIISYFMQSTDFMVGQGGFHQRAKNVAMMRAKEQLISQGKEANPEATEKSLNITNKQIAAVATDILNMTPAKIKTYQAQAKKELDQGYITKDQLGSRVDELIELGIPDDIRANAKEYMSRITGNSETPFGVLGAIHQAISNLKQQGGVIGTGTRFFFPFTRWAANWGNIIGDYMPPIAMARYFAWSPNWASGKAWPEDGKIRAMRDFMRRIGPKPSWVTEELNGESVMSNEDANVLKMKMVMGFAGFVGLLAVLSDYDDDDEPEIQLTGGMFSLSAAKRKQLLQSGIRPYSLIIGGRSWSYKNLPFAWMLGTVGNIQDGSRYGLREKDMGLITSAITQGATVVSEMSVLSSFDSFLQILGAKNMTNETRAKTMADWFGRNASGLVPFSSLDRDVENWFLSLSNQPTSYEAHGVASQFLRQMPAVTASKSMFGGDPVLNLLGEPIEYFKHPAHRMLGPETDDVWKSMGILASKGVYLTDIRASSTTDRKTGQKKAMTAEQLYSYKALVYKIVGGYIKRNHLQLRNARPESAQQYIDKLTRFAQQQARRELNLP
jgi:hypothetical protein